MSQVSLKDSPKQAIWISGLWIIINTIATVGIVFTNKAIFSDPALRHCQLSFASFHFLVTWLTLHVLSKSPLSLFVPRRAATRQMIPLAMAMCFNVILPNMSLAYSSVMFYQLARIPVTPAVALMNLLLYREILPLLAVFALVPVCVGVGMFTYSDSSRTVDGEISQTSTLGVVFAFTGVFASDLYTIWIASYHRKLQMSSMQLLYNQAPIASLLLLYIIPFLDVFPDQRTVPIHRWFMIALSGVLASLINISQFYIVAQTSPVSSTVVGHVKTCTIVALGWALSGRDINEWSVVGVFIAVGGIIV
ncbi:uncharacterized protein NECHADRAFT_46748 [Fusarium vanettenii 77-13-4]|uniref:GDP-mannose transporter n=1 Tax=Fusarium vanettenii (strain ATCC MYA-4622 / CBS 123669 / FGSC 9596 / NRRL 45880 / 77-13-4) TaxID=660122 RepID=C7YYX6_FUSV7|nr:uncharacterized protein NECHADRAFT_46748 [Fusarium vanettenii 77-13-4]EEU43075.1 hypothetical protein NECHADRAFT_46748 [Fusarium vanettenii 77-13-4]